MNRLFAPDDSIRKSRRSASSQVGGESSLEFGTIYQQILVVCIDIVTSNNPIVTENSE
jgi:hypothetical protein